MAKKRLPETTVRVRIVQHSWQDGRMAGEVIATHYQWEFQWCFTQGRLSIQPSLGRALILEPLSRFLERNDYQLELGGDYEFKVRAEI